MASPEKSKDHPFSKQYKLVEASSTKDGGAQWISRLPISLSNVTYCHHGNEEELLHSSTLSFAQGQLIVVVGTPGEGKHTFAGMGAAVAHWLSGGRSPARYSFKDGCQSTDLDGLSMVFWVLCV